MATTHSNHQMRIDTVHVAPILLAAGNVLLPMFFHALPNGGRMFLPLFFFTLVSGWSYGLGAGMTTAILSPLASHLLTGMPAWNHLPSILMSSVLLAGIAAGMSTLSKGRLLTSLIATVCLHQVLVGLMSPYPILSAVVHSAQVSWPGMAFQILGGYALVSLMSKGPSTHEG